MVQRIKIPQALKKFQDMLICPICGGKLLIEVGGNLIRCKECLQTFSMDGGIPLLFWTEEKNSAENVTKIVKAFYEKNPFPNYEDGDSRLTFRSKAEKGIFARLIDEQIPFGSTILEVGCGTGQLSNFLGMTWGRTIFATDICLNSLKLGQKFKQNNDINQVFFLQMNLFRPIFRPESFNLVLCNGVLHHTNNPFDGFRSIAQLVKKGGFITIGLYNKYGRIPNDIRRFLFSFTSRRLIFLDPRLRDFSVGQIKKHAWFMDQYKHPHELKHTIDEVLNWFDLTGFEFFNGIPKIMPDESFSENEQLFKKNRRGSSIDHLLTQMHMLLSGGREGGYFLMIGQKKI